MKKESTVTKKKKEEKMTRNKTKTERTKNESLEVDSHVEAQVVKDVEPDYPEQLAILINRVTGDLEKIHGLLWDFLGWGEQTSFDFRSWMLDKDVSVFDFQAMVHRLDPISRKLFEKCVPLGGKF